MPPPVRSHQRLSSRRSAESEAFVKAEVTKWTGLMKQAGIVPE
jgi:hypothetical protein